MMLGSFPLIASDHIYAVSVGCLLLLYTLVHFGVAWINEV